MSNVIVMFNFHCSSRKNATLCLPAAHPTKVNTIYAVLIAPSVPCHLAVVSVPSRPAVLGSTKIHPGTYIIIDDEQKTRTKTTAISH